MSCFNPQPAPSPAEGGSPLERDFAQAAQVSIRSRRRRRLKEGVGTGDEPAIWFQSAAGAVAG